MAQFLSHISVVPLQIWVIFLVGILFLIAIDLKISGKKKEKTSVRRALIESGMWISISLIFNAYFANEFGHKLGLEFLTGYLLEKSLSVDNLFVILLIFGAFRIAGSHQHRVLFYGVLGAIVMRGVVILVGVDLLHRFHKLLYVFGIILIFSAYKILRKTDEKLNLDETWYVRLLKRFFMVSENLDTRNFFVIEKGVRKVTTLFLALVVVEVTDLIFAVDSIPAVLSVTQDAFVAFASNILAVLGLRSLYFVLAAWVQKFRFLGVGIAVILGFIGVKLLISDYVEISSLHSLAFIISVLFLASLASWFFAPDQKAKG